MQKRSSGEKGDFMQFAREVVDRAIGEHIDGTPLEIPEDRRNLMLWLWVASVAKRAVCLGLLP